MHYTIGIPSQKLSVLSQHLILRIAQSIIVPTYSSLRRTACNTTVFVGVEVRRIEESTR